MLKGKKSNESTYFDHKQFLKLHDRVNAKLTNSTIGFKKNNTLTQANEHSLPSVRSAEKSNMITNKLHSVDAYTSEGTKYNNKSGSQGINRVTHTGENVSGWPRNALVNKNRNYLDVPNIYENKSKIKPNLLGKTG